MRPKIDLRQHYNLSEFPPDVAQLIEKCGGLSAAEKYAGMANQLLGTLRGGQKRYTDELRARVAAALASEKPTKGDQPMPANRPLDIPASCPPILAELIRFKGSKAAAWRALGTSEGTFYKVINSAGDMPSVWTSRAKAAMGSPIVAAPSAPEGPPIPEFVPWDGKSRGIFKVKPWGANKGRAIKNVPQPLLALLEKFDNVVGRASKAMGMTGNTIFLWMDGTREFDLTRQKAVHAAMHGISLTPEAASDFDTYKLDLAIVMLKGGQNFDRVHELAEALGGLLAWKKNTNTGWLLIYSMRAEVAEKFKRLAGRDASEIACP